MIKIYLLLLSGIFFCGCYLADPETPEPVIYNNSDISLYYLALSYTTAAVIDIAPYSYVDFDDEKILKSGSVGRIIFDKYYSTGDDVVFIFYAVDKDSTTSGKWLALFNGTLYLTGEEFEQRNFRIIVDDLEIKYPSGWMPD